jgi:hypothetical protein
LFYPPARRCAEHIDSHSRAARNAHG